QPDAFADDHAVVHGQPDTERVTDGIGQSDRLAHGERIGLGFADGFTDGIGFGQPDGFGQSDSFTHTFALACRTDGYGYGLTDTFTNLASADEHTDEHADRDGHAIAFTDDRGHSDAERGA
ncbi:hypothetical protein HY256_10810, partial [Candidatus Sumerlaeota bacterium]|nr:hypothetical protein [Candidatus Sumerlaeota bacterium]